MVLLKVIVSSLVLSLFGHLCKYQSTTAYSSRWTSKAVRKGKIAGIFILLFDRKFKIFSFVDYVTYRISIYIIFFRLAVIWNQNLPPTINRSSQKVILRNKLNPDKFLILYIQILRWRAQSFHNLNHLLLSWMGCKLKYQKKMQLFVNLCR